MLRSRTNRIILHKLNLKEISLHIPVADLTSGIQGPTILITAGMDGDEYTGIRAAYDLINYYSKQRFPGRIIIIPIVNVAGFYAGKSLNPLDNKYPKYILPGNKRGSATEQLMTWLQTNFLTETALWLDLHSGAMTEKLQPFIWAFQTKNKVSNQTTRSILNALAGNLIVYEKAPFLSKAERLAARQCAYLIFECGELGEQRPMEIARMVTWVKKSVSVMHETEPRHNELSSYQKVTFHRAQFDGLWLPAINAKEVEKGSLGGTLQSLDRDKTQNVTLKESGVVLWLKSALFAKKGDELIAVATDKRSL